MAAREPWKTLLTNHQARFTGYSFVEEPWSNIIDVQDLDQVGGWVVLHYLMRRAEPIVLDEDRYEQYRAPKHHRYFFRRFMWANLLSGGHPTYGGLRTYEPYDGGEQGVQGYFDAVTAGKLDDGAHDFPFIRRFFQETGLTLVKMTPDDSVVGGDPLRYKCAHSRDAFIIYLANPSGAVPETDDVADTVPSVTVQLPDEKFSVRWFDPRSGVFTDGGKVSSKTPTLTAPAKGDWVLLIRTPSAP